MYDLWTIPQNWCWVEFSDLGETVSGGTPSTKEPSYWGDEIGWISPSDLTGYNKKTISRGAKSLTKRGLHNSSAQLMPAGSVHFSSRAPIGYVVISSQPVSTNQGFKSIVPAQGIFNEYLYYFLKSAKSLAENRASGTTFKELSGAAFKRLPFPLPPTTEQHRIVDKIEELFSELDKGVENLETAREQLKVYRQALLKHAFEGKMTADWREKNERNLKPADALRSEILDVRCATWGKAQSKRYKIPVSVDAADLPPLPRAWAWVSLDELVSGEPRSLQSGPFGSSLKHSEFRHEGILVIGIDNVGSGQFSLGSQNRLPMAKFSNLTKYRARPGDLLITVMASLGRTCVVPRTLETAIITKHVYRVSIDHNYLLPEFYNLALQGPTVSRKRMLQGAQGQTRPGLNSSILREIPLPLCSLAEQQEIVSRLSQRLSELENLDKAVQEELLRAKALRQAILKRAFLGGLVAQDRNDEPASVLLERIKSQKAEQENCKKKIKSKDAA
jgi:type I restriction enzyme S subunit